MLQGLRDVLRALGPLFVLLDVVGERDVRTFRHGDPVCLERDSLRLGGGVLSCAS